VPPQAAGNVRQDGVPVVELYRERRAGKNLANVAKDFERRFFGVGDGIGFGFARLGGPLSIALCDSDALFS
jgi:hypothetical protein